MALPTNGYSDVSAKNFVLHSATAFTNMTFDPTDGFTGDSAGATSGGVGVEISTEYWTIEIDGTGHVDTIGLDQKGKQVCTITLNLAEMTAEKIRMAINGTKEDADPTEAPEGYKVIKSKRYLEPGDYIPNLGIVGKMSGSNDPVIIMLDNGLVTSSFNMSTEDNAAAVVELTIRATASYEQSASNEFPWRILHPDPQVTTTP
jgi:hypothetical protein